MTGVNLQVRLDDKGALDALNKLTALGHNPRPLMEIAGAVLEASVRDRFDRSRGPGGVPWPPSQRVVRGSRPSGDKIGPQQGGKTLIDQGNLVGSLRHEVEDNKTTVGFDGLSESAKHAASHQFGVHKTVTVKAHERTIRSLFGVPLPTPKTIRVKAHAMRMNIPKREMLGIDVQDRADLRAEWTDFLEGYIR